MPGGFSNKPKILRGAFVELGFSLPPLIVPFQFNPEQLSRTRSQWFSVPRSAQTGDDWISLRQYHTGEAGRDLLSLRDAQSVSVQEESINFDIRLDATDKLNEGDTITEQFGLAPQLATLELMMQPKGEGLLNQALGALLNASAGGFFFTKGENPPMILFIWGRKRVLPVNINSMNINETEFSTDLNPIRASVSVNLTVIEGKNLPYTYTQAMKEAMSILNLANIGDIANVVIPG